MPVRQRRATTAAVLACASGLLTALVPPAGALADVRLGLASTTDPFAAVVPATALAAWALLLWVGATALLTAGALLPGALGRGAAAVRRCIAPRAVRRAVELALGLSLAAGATAAPALAAPVAGVDAVSPVAAAPAAVPSLDWPSAASPIPIPPADEQPSATTPLVVAPGDTLWSLAAQTLGPGATDRQVAAAWPAWWSANRDVVGADPHLIRPGDRLTPPPAR